MKPAKNDPQGIGSTLTYARRYSLSAFLNLNTGDDDDGNNASDVQNQGKRASKPSTQGTLSDKQVNRLYAICKAKGFDNETVNQTIKKKFGKEINQLTKVQYDAVCKGYENLEDKR